LRQEKNQAMNYKTTIGRFRIVAILEGISFLLFGITMPLKYQWEIMWPNYYVGMTHGLLFCLYIFLCLQVIFIYRWGPGKSFLALAASLVPFGTFIADKKLFRPAAQNRSNY